MYSWGGGGGTAIVGLYTDKSETRVVGGSSEVFVVRVGGWWWVVAPALCANQAAGHDMAWAIAMGLRQTTQCEA